MSNEIKPEGPAVDSEGQSTLPQPDNAVKPLSNEDISKLIAEQVTSAVTAVQENAKKEISGLNQKITSLQNEKDELAKKSMTAEERKALLEKESNQKVKALETELTTFKREVLLTNLIVEHKLDLKLKPFVVGDTPEELTENTKTLKGIVDEQVKKGIEAALKEKFSQSTKIKSLYESTPDSAKTIQDGYDKAIKEGKASLAIAYRIEAQKAGITIKTVG